MTSIKTLLFASIGASLLLFAACSNSSTTATNDDENGGSFSDETFLDDDDGAKLYTYRKLAGFPITMVYALISVFAGFTIVSILTSGGPLGATQVLATSAFFIGIIGGNLPMGASVSLFMVPILAVAATFILRGIAKRGSEA